MKLNLYISYSLLPSVHRLLGQIFDFDLQRNGTSKSFSDIKNSGKYSGSNQVEDYNDYYVDN
jgi:hypothetical protein